MKGIIYSAVLIITISYVANYIKYTFNKFRKPKQTCFIYCPNCENELISSDSFIEDRDGLVKYRCTKCGRVSFWDFIHYPAPIRKTCAEDCKHFTFDESGKPYCKYYNEDECGSDTMVKFEQKWLGKEAE